MYYSPRDGWSITTKASVQFAADADSAPDKLEGRAAHRPIFQSSHSVAFAWIAPARVAMYQVIADPIWITKPS